MPKRRLFASCLLALLPLTAAAQPLAPLSVPFPRIVDRLQALGYLPLTQACIREADGTCQRHDAFRFPVPDSLQKTADQFAWDPENPFVRGAVVQFERVNGLLGPRGLSEGRLHTPVVAALFSAKAKPDPWRWRWVRVSKHAGTRIPEDLRIWRTGQSGKPGSWIFRTIVNTGVLGSTPDGTWPIYQRLPSTTMRGTFPEPISWGTYQSLAGQSVPQWTGSTLRQSARGLVNGHPVRWVPYDDPGILWVNYFDDGRGIHYYPRAAYGFPQSAGCVEEPYQAAPRVYRLLRYGVPVTVRQG